MSSLVGKKAPHFSAPAVVNGHEFVHDFSLEQFIGKKSVVFFFYPKDFTFVCPTELHAFQEKLEDFKKRDVEVVGCSTDTEQSHWSWLQIPKTKGGIKDVRYPIVADTAKTIATNYGVLAGEYEMSEDGYLTANGPMIAYRGLFLIDRKGIVRHQVINDFPLGRSVDEVIRMVDALAHFEEFGEVCPANWIKGGKAMTPTHEGITDFMSQ